MNKNVSAYMLMAEECLADARMLFVMNRYRGAASRAYYCYYDAVRALLASKDIICKSHSAARSLFGEHFIKNGPFNGQDAKDFHSLFNLRQNSDYDPDELRTVDEVKKSIDVAAEFLLQVEAYLRQNNFAS